MNKKAITLRAILILVISLICLAILIYVSVKIYQTSVIRSNLERAKITLDQIISAIGDGRDKYMVQNPEEWYLLVYKKGENSPASCSGENCLCICRGKGIEDCGPATGTCRKIQKEVGIADAGPSSTIKNYIILKPLPKDLFFKTEGEEVLVSQYQKIIIFDNFLSTKSGFLDKGEISFRDQIKFYVNSVEKYQGIKSLWRVTYKIDENIKNEFIKNVQEYFKDYEYPIWVILKEGGVSSPSILAISAGKEGTEGSSTSLPSFVIENPGGKISNIVVIIQWRRK